MDEKLIEGLISNSWKTEGYNVEKKNEGFFKKKRSDSGIYYIFTQIFKI
jgi:hypothetical protein